MTLVAVFPLFVASECSGDDGAATTDVSTSTGTSTTTGTQPDTTSDPTGEPACSPGELVCDDDHIAKECDQSGEFGSPQNCPDVCVVQLGCVTCSPGATRCEGDTPQQCDETGQWTSDAACDALQGLACDNDVGACMGPCAELPIGDIGCEFFPTIVASSISVTDVGLRYALTVANTADDDASVVVEIAGARLVETTIAAGESAVLDLPWVNKLTGAYDGSRVGRDGAFHLRSTQPVTVAQYHPVNADATADATVLLPTHAWGTGYRIPSYAGYLYDDDPMYPNPSTFTVTALRDGTEVVLSPPPGGAAVDPGETPLAADGTGSVILDRGDMLKVMAAGLADLSGAAVDATAPVQVLGGSMCSFVPSSELYCDHLEAVVVPTARAGTQFIAAPPPHRLDPSLDTDHVVRVTALSGSTTISVSPGSPHALAAAGDFVELTPSSSAYWITADNPVMVAQYSVGGQSAPGASDPSMVVTPAVSHYRSAYTLVATPEWPATYAEIIAPENASVTVDGLAQGDAVWSPIDGAPYVRGRVLLDPPGLHTVEADDDIGVTVYASDPVDGEASFWLAGGYSLAP